MSSFGSWVAVPVSLLLAYALGWLVTQVGVAWALWPLRRASQAPWPERARLAYAARRLVSLNAALIPMAVGVPIFYRGQPAWEWVRSPWAVATGLAGLAGVIQVGRGLERRLCQAPAGSLGASVGLRWLLALPMLFPFALTLALIPGHWGWRAVVALGAGAALTTVNVRGGMIRVWGRLGLARPSSDRLRAVVARTAERAGVPPRAVFELDSLNANALAWPVPGYLLYTTPLLAVLDDDELAAITAHELGHLREPWPVYWARILIAYLPVIAPAGIPLAGSFGIAAGLAPPAMLVAGVWLFRRVGRRMEERADRLGAGEDPQSAAVFARAVEKIYEVNLAPVVMRGRRHVHPHLYDRMLAAGCQPAYARPAAPRGPGLAILPTMALFYLGLWLAFAAFASP